MNEEIRKKQEEAFLRIEQHKRKLEEKIEKQKKEAALLLKKKNEAKKKEKEKKQDNQKNPNDIACEENAKENRNDNEGTPELVQVLKTDCLHQIQEDQIDFKLEETKNQTVQPKLKFECENDLKDSVQINFGESDPISNNVCNREKNEENILKSEDNTHEFEGEKILEKKEFKEISSENMKKTMMENEVDKNYQSQFDLDPVKVKVMKSPKLNEKKPFIIKKFKLKETVMAYEAKFRTLENPQALFHDTPKFPSVIQYNESNENIEEDIEIEESKPFSGEIPKISDNVSPHNHILIEKQEINIEQQEKTQVILIPAHKLKKKEIPFSVLEKRTKIEESKKSDFCFEKEEEVQIKEETKISQINNQNEDLEKKLSSPEIIREKKSIDNYPEEDLYLKEIQDYEDEFEPAEESVSRKSIENQPFSPEKLNKIEENEVLGNSDDSFEKEIEKSREIVRSSREKKYNHPHSSINFYENSTLERPPEISNEKPQATTEKNPNYITFQIDIVEDKELMAKKMKALEIKKQKKLQELQRRKTQQNLQETAKFGGLEEKLKFEESPNTKYNRNSETPNRSLEKPNNSHNSLIIKKENSKENLNIQNKEEKKLTKAKSQIVTYKQKPMKNEEKAEERKSVTPNQIKKPNKSIIISPEEKKVVNANSNNSISNNINPNQTPKNTNSKKTASGQKFSFTKSSNLQLIRNAISNVCLAGEPNKKEREAVLEKIAELNFENVTNFIIIFKGVLGRQVNLV